MLKKRGQFDRFFHTITKARVQKSGNQNGFDILLIVSKNYTENKIFIECKNYESDISIGNILKKGLNLESNYGLNENDLFIAINPRSNFSNEDNSEKLSPILSQKFKFSYYALDLTNGVKELFALNNNFYKLIYGDDIDFEINEQKEIDRFKNIIFSRKPFKKVIITDTDKIRFIGEINLDQNNIERYFYQETQNITLPLRKEKKDDLTLSKVLEKEDKIFIIGNPGIGKSTELKKFALQNWETGETENFVPIFKSLKNFTNTDHISNYLPLRWEELNKVFFILDGIDEIGDIEYFKSKLENFINQNTDSQKKHKYIISCRTNVYESIVKGIPNFKVYYLRDLNYYESIDLLKIKCGSIIDNLNFYNSFANFLKTPFQLEILANFINSKKQLPKNTTILWETYINNRLSHDRNEKLKKINLNIPALKKWSMKISLINELMKSNIIDEDDLYTSLSEDTLEFEDFKKNPLINKLVNQEKYFFEHRNIQEYFAALALSKLPSEKIKDFLIIDKEINKTHPTLFNCITFLINIIDSEKYDQLVGWLIENEPELLFKADSDRTERYKVKIFQHYFQSECVEKTFWINNSKTFAVKEIAQFGDCEINFDYLLNFINDKNCHFRAKVSALELLSHFSVPSHKEENLKNIFFDLLMDSQNSEMTKSHILECIYDLKLYQGDQIYLDNIFELFKNETSKQINRALLSFVEESENVDSFFWYIKPEFMRDHGFIQRETPDEVVRGTSWILERLILKLDLPKNFIDLAKYYFDETRIDYIDNTFLDELIDRCSYFENLDSNFLVNLFSSFSEITNYYFRENSLKKLILKSKTLSKLHLFEYLTENFAFSIYGYFLALITEEQTIDLVIGKFITGTIEKKNLDYYRNVVANHNRKLAEYFNDTMIEKGFIFDQPFLYSKQFEQLLTKFKNKPQEEFNLLFDKNLLLCKIEEIFQEYGNPINSARIREIDKDWYKKNAATNKIDISHSLLNRIVHRQKTDLEFQDVKQILDDDTVIIKEIKTQIQRLHESNKVFEVDNIHIKFIFDWCLKACAEVDFTKIIKYVNLNSVNLLQDYYKLKAILYFIIKFDFNFSQEFLLNSIEFIDINKTTAQDGNLQLLILKIKNRELINKKIIENLLNGKLYSFSLNMHIQYALDNHLEIIYPKIGEYLSMPSYSYNIDKILNQYIELTNDIDLLKNLCDDLNSHKCWSALKLLSKLKNESDFCLRKSVEYLNTEIDQEKNYYYSNALSILFELNSLEALKHVFMFLDLERSPSLNQNSFATYNAIENYETLSKLYDKMYIGDRDKLAFTGLGNFMATYVSNLSKDRVSYLQTQQELVRIKPRLENSDSNSELFYINQLIEDSKKSFLNSRSKSLIFKNALLKVEEINK